MRTIKIVLAYDGTAFYGWQRQKDVVTIQGSVESALLTMVGLPVVLHGAGRTDAGVHALAMVAHFKTNASIPCAGFLKGLNSILPADIRVISVVEAEDDFHARFCAVGKTYFYNFISSTTILPTDRLYNGHLPAKRLNFSRMQEALNFIVGEQDFSSFEKSGSRDLSWEGGRGAVRTIYKSTISPVDSSTNRFCIEIHGDGFLRHMVRNIVGTVYEVGLGKWSSNDFERILAGKSRSLAGRTAPANGLFLKEVFY